MNEHCNVHRPVKIDDRRKPSRLKKLRIGCCENCFGIRVADLDEGRCHLQSGGRDKIDDGSQSFVIGLFNFGVGCILHGGSRIFLFESEHRVEILNQILMI